MLAVCMMPFMRGEEQVPCPNRLTMTRRGKIESTSSVYVNLIVGKKDVGAPNFVDQLAVPERALFGGSRPLGWLRRVVERQARVGLLL